MVIKQNNLNLPYTICFCIAEEKILLLHRKKHPNKDLWNGVGGKLEKEENPIDSILREMMEEASLNGKLAKRFEFRGIVSWFWKNSDKSIFYNGMYAFIAYFDPKYIFEARETPEGLLEWKDLEWALNSDNLIVSNIPHFLPSLLSNQKPKEHRCYYIDDKLQKVSTHQLQKRHHLKVKF